MNLVRFRRGSSRPGSRRGPTAILVAVLVASSLLVAPVGSAMAVTPANGTMVVGSLTGATAGITLPRGAVWVPDTTGIAAGGHWWVTDQILGVCRVDPIAPAPAGPPQFTTSNCNGSAKSGGQVVVGDVPGSATTKYLYVADAATKSVHVLRFTLTLSSGTLGSPLAMNVPSNTQKGGGVAGARPVSLALVTSPGAIPVPKPSAKWPTSLAAGEQDLLVSYVKSGDVFRVFDVNHTISQNPLSAQIGSTSDGIGTNAFAMVGNDLYIAEAGGLGGLSKIVDPTGKTRAPCTDISMCTAIGTGSTVGFPGGLATDGTTYVYAGDVRTGGGSNNIYRINVSTNPVTTELYSSTVTPTYQAKSSSQVVTTFSSYVFPLGLGYRSDTGELYIGDDPQFLAATVTNQQGHLWRVPFTPVVASVAPSNGPNAGGTSVTITGQGFIPTAGATTFKFGGVAATGVTCASTTSCTATTPAGSGTVDLVASVSVPGQPFAPASGTLAAAFTYTTAVAPSVTSIAPSLGPLSGGTVVTITGTGFSATAGSTTVTFGLNAATSVSCADSTTCTATSPASASPAGISNVDVLVTVGGLTSAAVPADLFTYDTSPIVTGLVPSTGPTTGGTSVTISGTGFDTTGNTTVTFGGIATTPAGTFVTCTSTTSCNATSPAGTGIVDVVVQDPGGTSAVNAGDKFTYTATDTPAITSVAPSTGATAGGTVVTISGSNLTNIVTATPIIKFGGTAATFITCANATTCTADSPSAAAGVVDVTATVNDPANAAATLTSPLVAADKFTYVASAASLYSWGITAPKGGAAWLPGTLGGHWWSSDHAQGLCRQDAVPTTGQFGIAGNTLHAINFAVCASDLVGSAGQAVYDPRPVVVGATTFANLHYVYVPDNAVKSTAVWRLTFDSTTETMVADPLDGLTMATAMTPLADVRTLKPNGMALGPLNADGTLNAASPAFGLYVTDLTEKYVRVITNPGGDPRTQTINIVAATGDGRGANGTQGFIGSYLYVSGNRAVQFFDVTLCPSVGNAVPPAAAACGMASVPAPAGVFVAGTAVDPINKLVYLSDSPGAAASIIHRYDASHDVYVKFLDGAWNTAGSGVVIDLNNVVHCEAGTFGANPPSAGIGCLLGPQSSQLLAGGNLPAPSSPNGTVVCALTCQRPWDQANHSTAGIPAGQPVPTTFAFAFGLAVGPTGDLVITEDPSAGARSGRGTMWTVPFVP